MKRTIILGKGTLAIQAAEWIMKQHDFDLEAIVPVVPEPAWTDSLMDWALANGVPLVESGNYKDLLQMQPAGAALDLVVSIFYDRIIDAHFIRHCNRIINLHNSALPRYRGVSPINWALKNRETTHGVTIHEITPGIDDGPIIGQVIYPIYPEFDEVIDVYQRSLEYGRVLFETTMPLIDFIEPREQDSNNATYYSRSDDAALGERRGFTRAESNALRNTSTRSLEAT